jgi:polyphosphate glucokinase
METAIRDLSTGQLIFALSTESKLGVIIVLTDWRRVPNLTIAEHKLTSSNMAIGVDVGGSSIKCALIDLVHGTFASDRFSVPTPAHDSVETLLTALAQVVANIPGEYPVGVAFPSVIRNGTVCTAANLNKAWIGQPLAELASRHLLRPVVAINDADAAGMAELRYGVADEVPGTVLLLTLGTGIGSALFAEGRLVPNTEFGHLEVQGREAELRASGRAKVEQNLSWDAWAAELDLVLHELHALLWPDLIVLCGGITEEPEKFMDKLHCKARLCIGALRSEAGIVGAALATTLMARQEPAKV